MYTYVCMFICMYVYLPVHPVFPVVCKVFEFHVDIILLFFCNVHVESGLDRVYLDFAGLSLYSFQWIYSGKSSTSAGSSLTP